jgi:hypothetical protein
MAGVIRYKAFEGYIVSRIRNGFFLKTGSFGDRAIAGTNRTFLRSGWVVACSNNCQRCRTSYQQIFCMIHIDMILNDDGLVVYCKYNSGNSATGRDQALKSFFGAF